MSIAATPALPPAAADLDALRDLHFRALQREMSGAALAPDPPPPASEPDISFHDVLSAINPLQHLPVIGNIYRAITGDVINPVARVVGGALYGGPIGFMTAAVNAVVEDISGRDIGGQLLAMVGIGDKTAPAAAQLAAAPPPAALSAPPPPAPDAVTQPSAAAAPPPGKPVTPPTTKPTEVAALHPTLAPTANAPRALPTQGRDLSSYWAYAGTRGPLPTAATQRPVAAASPLRPGSINALRTLPLPIAAAVSQAEESPRPAATPSAAAPSPGRAADAAPVRPEGPPSQWFAAAMTRGLDRYQASNRLSRPHMAADFIP